MVVGRAVDHHVAGAPRRLDSRSFAFQSFAFQSFAFQACDLEHLGPCPPRWAHSVHRLRVECQWPGLLSEGKFRTVD